MIEKGSVVSVHYTGKYTDGQTFDSSLGRDPLEFQVGEGQLIEGFENAVMGKKSGDKITVNISASEAYGEVKEELFIKFDKSQMPGEVTEGMILEAQGPSGQPIQVKVKEVQDEHVIIDTNHALAGKDLVFEIEIVEVQ